MRRQAEHPYSSSASAPLAPSRPRATRGERIVIWIVSGLVVAGLVLGVSKHGQPLSPRARELFIPAGVMLLLLIGCDPSAGVLPSAFGVAVKDAHCSHGATAYTVAVAGAGVLGSVRCHRRRRRPHGDFGPECGPQLFGDDQGS
jgi:hypothetical protein